MARSSRPFRRTRRRGLRHGEEHQGVVEARSFGRRRRALSEIGTVSQQLAQLIEGITTTTEQQAKSANDVATA